MKKVNFTPQHVKKISALAQIPVTSEEENKLAAGFNKVIGVVDELFNVDVKDVVPVSQVTGLTNITRADEIDSERTFTQAEALSNAKRTHNGFFAVNQVIDKNE